MAMLAFRHRFCIAPPGDGIVATRMGDIVIRLNFTVTEVLPRNPPSPKKDMRIVTYEVLSTPM